MSTKTVDICETHEGLSELITLAQEGTEVILANGATPLARIVPVEPVKKKRIAGLHEGQGWMSDDFNAPMTEDFREGKL